MSSPPRPSSPTMRPVYPSSSSRSNSVVRRNSHGSLVAPNITSTAGVEYDSIRVLDEAVSSHGTIYYSVHVSCMESPLDNYTIRRRYNDFKSFHATLSRYMPTAPFGFVAFKAAIKSIDEDEPDSTNTANNSTFLKDSTEDSSHHATMDVVYLPPMPIGGLLAIMTSKDTLIRSRIAMFNRILEAALEDGSRPVAEALRNFIKEAPGGSLHRTLSSMSDSTNDKKRTKSRSSSASSYVSLRDYAAPELTLSLERDARRRTASFGRQTNRLFLDCAIKAVEAVENGSALPLSSSSSSTAATSSPCSPYDTSLLPPTTISAAPPSIAAS
ncbi:hypothetical protein SPRG_12236 [Saprolegnia parasitica CBS 223.65]|uniref:PX domain-containing protein n=1 Tax=Saprolegnia parasitica (strain CBS 223.65) TaxID=695850 RepID=A0A067C5D0_SAPPC|nr:hypothetical protein SPRG_12236 [Saprolegnia parasitica CBS 223.65]KDO22027.1 hypothetical protein SPRG_12236 [Saprolegnia parasitica CBS 223.65]|eukprot:XP_012207270.1 hypothetical protein SPRG_12236 [Saprolegnia parasitica CBS 223.65]